MSDDDEATDDALEDLSAEDRDLFAKMTAEGMFEELVHWLSRDQQWGSHSHRDSLSAMLIYYLYHQAPKAPIVVSPDSKDSLEAVFDSFVRMDPVRRRVLHVLGKRPGSFECETEGEMAAVINEALSRNGDERCIVRIADHEDIAESPPYVVVTAAQHALFAEANLVEDYVDRGAPDLPGEDDLEYEAHQLALALGPHVPGQIVREGAFVELILDDAEVNALLDRLRILQHRREQSTRATRKRYECDPS